MFLLLSCCQCLYSAGKQTWKYEWSTNCEAFYSIPCMLAVTVWKNSKMILTFPENCFKSWNMSGSMWGQSWIDSFKQVQKIFFPFYLWNKILEYEKGNSKAYFCITQPPVVGLNPNFACREQMGSSFQKYFFVLTLFGWHEVKLPLPLFWD